MGDFRVILPWNFWDFPGLSQLFPIRYADGHLVEAAEKVGSIIALSMVYECES